MSSETPTARPALPALWARALAALSPKRKAAAAQRLEATDWLWPMPNAPDGRKAVISDGVHVKGEQGAIRTHRGVDICYRRPGRGGAPALPWKTKLFEALPGTHILACGSGKVTVAKRLRTGFAVCVDHGSGVETAYHHLSKLHCSVGDVVKPGDSLGLVGGSPIGYGFVHLHFDLVVCGKFVDPAPLLKYWPRSATAPASPPSA